MDVDVCSFVENKLIVDFAKSIVRHQMKVAETLSEARMCSLNVAWAEFNTYSPQNIEMMWKI